jgi:hypothetical protein
MLYVTGSSTFNNTLFPTNGYFLEYGLQVKNTDHMKRTDDIQKARRAACSRHKKH